MLTIFRSDVNEVIQTYNLKELILTFFSIIELKIYDEKN